MKAFDLLPLSRWIRSMYLSLKISGACGQTLPRVTLSSLSAGLMEGYCRVLA